jgi:hypothetical protein
MHDPRFVNTLELAVRFGKTLIVQVRLVLRAYIRLVCAYTWPHKNIPIQ